jgi:ubiquinone/menaquinone biosynthesis C-methylase UbiE
LEKWDVVHQVTFIKADGAHLERVIDDGFADMSVSYRFLEELKRPEEMAKTIEEMTRIVKENGRVCVIELNTEAKNEAEENYIRLHAESGDSLFSGAEILEAFRKAKLRQIHAETFEAQIWFSPQLAKQDLGLAQVWFTEDEEKRLGARIDKYGMKYPAFLIFSGVK